jgi:hypothetical protein
VVDRPGTIRVPADNVDGDETFPLGVRKYSIVDGWLFFVTFDGAWGVVLGTKADLIKWMSAVDKENTERPVVSEPWDADKHGGAQHVQDTLDMATKTLRRFGLSPIPMKVWVDTRPMAASTAAGGVINFVNIHDGHNEHILDTNVPWSKSVGAHEASHVGFTKHPQQGHYVIDVLKWRQSQGKPPISIYHAISGHGEGVAEAGAAYMLIPKVMEEKEPELYAACAYWFGDGPKPKETDMEPRIANRRQAAEALTRMELTNPTFNMREIVKQLTLLEDHLAHPYKMCMDCVRKHLITVEAFAEEATAMDTTGETAKTSELMAECARVWMEQVMDEKRPVSEIAQEIRNVRKALMPNVCDPRGSVARVAALHLDRIQPCNHR